MRVLLSAYACEPGRGSELGTGWNWANSLAVQGHDVIVLTRPDGKGAIDRELQLNPNPRLQFEFISLPNKRATRLRGNAGVYAKYLAWQKQAYLVARSLDFRFDVVHHVSWGSLMGGTQLWRLGIPLVFGPVGGAQRVPSNLRSLVRSDRLRQAIRAANLSVAGWGIKRRYLSQAAQVLATNGETHELATRMGATNVGYFVDSGLPPIFTSAAPVKPASNGPLRVLWVGRLVPTKAVLLALQGIAEVKSEVKFTVVGDGPDKGSALALASKLGLGDRVRFVGQVPWTEMPRWYLSHDAFLFTSVLDSFGGQLLEAMASRLPIVTLNHQGAAAFVPKDAGVKIPIAAPEKLAIEIAAALDLLATSPETRQRMGAAGWSYANTETWSARAERMTTIYEQVASVATP